MGQTTQGGRWLIVVAILFVGFPSPWTTTTTTTTTTVHAFSASPTESLSSSSSSSSSSSAAPPPNHESIEHLFIEFVDVTTTTTAAEEVASWSPSSLSSSNNKLPVSWTQNWSTWVLEPMKSATTSTATTTNNKESPWVAGDVFVKIPDTDGFVPPSSVDTLFQPIDLVAPTMSLALGVHIRDGTIRHVMPAVDVSYRHRPNPPPPQEEPISSSSSLLLSSQSHHRNRGLCSVPRAYQWIEYSHGVAFWLQSLELKAWKHKMVPKSSNNNNSSSSENNKKDVRDENKSSSSSSSRGTGDDQPEAAELVEEEWMEVASFTSGASLVQAIERVQYALVNEPPPELGDGSHILHVLLEDRANPQQEEERPTSTAVFDSPKTGYEFCVVLQERRRDVTDDDDDATTRGDPSSSSRSATAAAAAPPYQQPHVYGILHVGVSATMAGSESEYLPEAYRPLYEDSSLRNPTYEQFRERRRQQLQQQQQQQQQRSEL